jgi:hypothetical protein
LTSNCSIDNQSSHPFNILKLSWHINQLGLVIDCGHFNHFNCECIVPKGLLKEWSIKIVHPRGPNFFFLYHLSCSTYIQVIMGHSKRSECTQLEYIWCTLHKWTIFFSLSIFSPF